MLELINSDKGDCKGVIDSKIPALAVKAATGQYTGGLYHGLAIMLHNGDLIAHDRATNNYFSISLAAPLEVLGKASHTKDKNSDTATAMMLEQKNMNIGQMNDAVKVVYGTGFNASEAREQAANYAVLCLLVVGEGTELYNAAERLRATIALNTNTINDTVREDRTTIPRLFQLFDTKVQMYLKKCTDWDPTTSNPPPSLDIESMLDDIELGTTFSNVPMGLRIKRFITAYDNGEQKRHGYGGQGQADNHAAPKRTRTNNPGDAQIAPGVKLGKSTAQKHYTNVFPEWKIREGDRFGTIFYNRLSTMPRVRGKDNCGHYHLQGFCAHGDRCRKVEVTRTPGRGYQSESRRVGEGKFHISRLPTSITTMRRN